MQAGREDLHRSNRLSGGGCPWLAAFALLLAVPGRTPALLLDDFESGSFSVVATQTGSCPSGPCWSFEIGVDTPSGARLVVATSPFGTMTASLAQSSRDDSVAVGHAAASGNVGIVEVVYGLPVPADFTEGGRVDRLLVDVLALSGVAAARGTVVTPPDQPGGPFEVFGTASIPVGDVGTLSIPFSAFLGSPDLTQVDQVSLALELSGDATVAFDDVRTGVPEPAVAVLLAAVLLWLAWGSVPSGGPDGRDHPRPGRGHPLHSPRRGSSEGRSLPGRCISAQGISAEGFPQMGGERDACPEIP